jgi:iron complex outermembrane receptor protein
MRAKVSPRLAAAAFAPWLVATAFGQETRIEEIVVTSTALRENPLETALPVTVLGGDKLRREAAASLGETLSGELGISSTYFGPSASRPVIRGLGGYRVQVLQDGAAALDISSLSQDHAVSIESVVAEQIEIIKGPATLLYGSGAAGGLINVVTSRIPRKLPNAVTGAVELRGDTAVDERTVAASVAGAAGAIAWHVDAFDRSTDEVRIPSFAQSRHLRERIRIDGDTPDDAHGRIENSASDTTGGALGASLIGSQGFAGASWSRYETTYGIPVESDAFIDMQQDRLDVRGEWLTETSWLSALHFSAARNDYEHTEFEARGVPGTRFEQTAYEARLAADHTWSDAWRGTFGVQYLDNDFQAFGEEAFVPPSITRALSLFAFEERHGERWTVELGIRAERQTIEPKLAAPEYQDTAFSLSTGFVFKPADDLALSAHLTRTERHPQAAELYAHGAHLAAGRIELGNAALSKETARTIDFTLRGNADALRWTVSAFYNDYSDYIYLRPTDTIDEDEALPVHEYRQQGAKLYGYEAEILWPLADTSAGRLEVRIASDYVRGKLDNGEHLPQLPPLRIGAGLHFESASWHLGLEAFHSLKQDRLMANELPTDSHTMLDLDASYRFTIGRTDALLFMRGTNLLDEDARLATSPLKDVAPLAGRSWHVGIRAQW